MERLLQTYGENMASISVEGRERHPLCSMWDPMVAMSFEEEGRERYADFLKRKVRHRSRRLTGLTEWEKKDFSELTLEECWFGFHYDGSDPISETDIREQTRRFRLWQDNAQWRMEELTAYFCRMEERLKTVKEDLYLFPGISQWGYFLNIDGSRLTDQDADFCDLWDTAVRGVDIYGLAPHVDCCHFLTVPVYPGRDAGRICERLPAQHDAGAEQGQAVSGRNLLGKISISGSVPLSDPLRDHRGP